MNTRFIAFLLGVFLLMLIIYPHIKETTVSADTAAAHVYRYEITSASRTYQTDTYRREGDAVMFTDALGRSITLYGSVDIVETGM